MPSSENEKVMLQHGCAEAEALLKLIAGCLGVDLALLKESVELSCIKRTGFVDVYAHARNLGKEAELLLQVVGRERLVAMGVHIGRINGRYIPMLGFLSLLRRIGVKPKRGYVRLTEGGAKHFLYGHDVWGESISEVARPAENCRGLVAVLNERGEPIGWGRLQENHDHILVQNLVDLGWYLRSGV
ncbi:MAG: hypothetical protein ABWW70_02345 [Thermoproteota archaeon]